MFEIKEVKNAKTSLTKKYWEASYKKIENCDPLTKIAGVNMIAFINEKREQLGFTAIISQGYRTVEEQKKLYEKGRTKEGKIVTNCDGIIKKSKHQLGHAYDIAIMKNKLKDKGVLSWDPKEWAKLIFEMKKFKILFELKYPKYEMILGAEWHRFKDMPHVEIKKREGVE